MVSLMNIKRLMKYFRLQFTTKPDVGWVGGFAPLSGVILFIILAIIVICSMQWIRRGGHFQVIRFGLFVFYQFIYFQVFYWTHLLYLPFFALLIVHAENFWVSFCIDIG